MVSDEAWLGVLVPSVDRVGRYFPLTVAAPIVVELDPVMTFWSNSRAFAQFEDLALMALDLHLDFDDFETRVSGAATPLVAPMKNTEDTTTPLPQETPRCCKVAVVGEWGDPDVAGKLQSRILGIRQPYCIWAKEGDTPEERAVLCTEKLPPGEEFCAMLDLEWEQHGWQCLS